MRWIGRYIETLLTFPEMTSRMRFHVYITVKDKTNCLASFLFWRALSLYNRKKEDDKGQSKSLFINLGRPNFGKLIDEVWVKNEEKNHYVYAWGPNSMIDQLQKICLRKSEPKKKQIIFNYEEF